ncbi:MULTISPECIES: RcnB family protein [unclassified Brenneria]|uniref:RcnB family protein n=1 Tax=unclassified Brenneria TaxID=2634434 RepID=UPI0018F0944E|nr:RcnB family protein [Brenneria sp. L3-3C-1]MBJ7220667.1 RcnB family protein [Brenneria sp. L3-3C-1]MEE3641910.1 RcnB family protein [Brenneria sp. L3_3C_1]
MTKKTLALAMSLFLITSSFSPLTFAEGPNRSQDQKWQQGNNQKGGERTGKQRNVSNGHHNSDKGKNGVKSASREQRNTAKFRERDHFAWNGNDFRKGQAAPKHFRGDNYRVNDWRVRGLREPPAGQHWAYINGNYVLIAAATGIITAILLNSALN